MSKIKSLNITMVLFIFFIMITAGLLTAVCFLFFYAMDFFPLPFLTPILSPFIALLVSSIIGTSLSAVVSDKFLRPLHRIIDATKVIAKGDFSVRVPETESDSDIAVLMRNFNLMTEELQSIEMFRSDFINDFSHEFKTPIVSIRGFAKQLQNENLSPEKRKEYTDIIISESERLTKMSSNVLLLTKFENLQYVTGQTEYDLDEQIRNCTILLEKQWSKKNINMSLNLSEVRIFNNEEMLSHVWINLIDNAIKYSHEDGTISMVLYETSESIYFKISDSGEGMDENTMNHVFDKFYQGDRSRATNGNGLGLSIVKRIVNICKGEISVESKLGAGTSFSVTLPKSKEKELKN